MCTYNISLDDALIERIKPAFSGEESMHKWMQHQLEKAMTSLAFSLPNKEEKKNMLSQRLRGIVKAPENFDYKKELEDRF